MILNVSLQKDVFFVYFFMNRTHYLLSILIEITNRKNMPSHKIHFLLIILTEVLHNDLFTSGNSYANRGGIPKLTI